MYLITYARIISVPHVGILMDSVEIAGFAESKVQAEEIARVCGARTTSKCTIMPKIHNLGATVQAFLPDLNNIYDKLADQLYEAEQVEQKEYKRVSRSTLAMRDRQARRNQSA